MRYCYRMHWYADRGAPLNAGRALYGLTKPEAIANAADLWREGARRWAVGYVVVDTDEGEVIWRHERRPPPDGAARAGALRRMARLPA
jgi:hypothetical protein